MNDALQDKLREAFLDTYAEISFPETPTPAWRYAFQNSYFGHSDGVVLYSFLRYLQPSRVIEVGSGHSSALILDVNESVLDNRMRCTFVDPYPFRLEGLLKSEDADRCEVIPRRVQDLPLSLFETLETNDVLFIDSSHCVKMGSDVNWLFFEILPRLAPGVYVHLHDVFNSFEYPERWIQQGFAWNEAYLLHAFLLFNKQFEIAYFSSYQESRHREWFEKHMPLCLRKRGQSIWLRVREQ